MTLAKSPNSLALKNGRTVDFPAVMGILNVTPDSFSDGGHYTDEKSLENRIEQIISQGADIIDIGGQSTRPGAPADIDFEEEYKRVVPALEKTLEMFPQAIVSIDTTSARLADICLEKGAVIINDISALEKDPQMAAVAKKHDAVVVLMHMQGNPETMQASPWYQNVVDEICEYFKQRVKWCASQGIAPKRIVLDPGVGFGKTLDHNLAIIKNMGEFKKLGFAVLAGLSRKSFIGQLTGKVPQDRLIGSVSAAVCAHAAGADIFRVHDVLQTVEALKISEAVNNA